MCGYDGKHHDHGRVGCRVGDRVETEFVSVGSAKEEEAALPEELIEIDDDGADDEDDVPGTGTVSGGFGFAGLALAIVSLTTNWTSGIASRTRSMSRRCTRPARPRRRSP